MLLTQQYYYIVHILEGDARSIKDIFRMLILSSIKLCILSNSIMVGHQSNPLYHPSAISVIQMTGTMEKNKQNRRCGPKPSMRQIPIIMCLPGSKITLLSTLSPFQSTLCCKTLTESQLRQAAMTDSSDQDRKTGSSTSSQKKGSLDFSPTPHQLNISSEQQVPEVTFSQAFQRLSQPFTWEGRKTYRFTTAPVPTTHRF